MFETGGAEEGPGNGCGCARFVITLDVRGCLCRGGEFSWKRGDGID